MNVKKDWFSEDTIYSLGIWESVDFKGIKIYYKLLNSDYVFVRPFKNHSGISGWMKAKTFRFVDFEEVLSNATDESKQALLYHMDILNV